MLDSTNQLQDKRITALKVDTQNRLWVGTRSGGLALFKNEQLSRIINQNDGLPDNHIRVIEEDSNSYIWLGTASGGVVKLLLESDSLLLSITDQRNGLR